MAGLARWCVRRKNLVVLPASDSATAYNLLARGGSDAAKVTTGTIVWDTPADGLKLLASWAATRAVDNTNTRDAHGVR